MSYIKLLQEDRRLTVLRLLAQSPGHGANHYVLQAGLDQMGHKVSRDLLKSELAWLAEQGLVAIEDLGGPVVASLSGRGEDVASGRAVVPGVKKPVPGE